MVPTTTDITMDNQIQTDGQNVNGQGSSSPPEWFHAFAQQMVAHMTHMTQRMDTIEQQSQGQPPSSVEQATPLSTPTMVDTATSAPPPSDVIGLDWSWIGDSIQSNPELGHFLIWSSDCLARFSSGAKRLIQLERSNPIQNGLQSNNITGAHS